MKHRRVAAAVAGLVTLLLAGRAWAWWDTQIQVVKPPPTMSSVMAWACPGIDPKFIVADPTASAGKSVRLEAGGPILSFQYDCRISHYAVYVICRAVDAAVKPPVPPVILHLRVTNLATGDVRTWRQRIPYTAEWEDGGHLYFPVRSAGKYRIEVFSGPKSTAAVYVDFLQLKDIFGNLPCVGEKTSQNLHTAAEIAAIRKLDSSKQAAVKLAAEFKRAGLLDMDAEKAASWRAETFRNIWASIPPRNLHFAAGDKLPGPIEWQLNKGWGPWVFTNAKTKAIYTLANWQRGETTAGPYPDDGAGYHVDADKTVDGKPIDNNWLAAALMNKFRSLKPLAAKRAQQYLETGNETAGWEGVCALLAFCELYPDIDFQTQRFHFAPNVFGMNPYGKFLYSGHAINIVDMVEAYDDLFPLIQGNEDLAALMHEQVPWVNTPADVVRFMDTQLLQHIRDCVDRQIIRAGDGDSEMVLGKAALAQGPGKAADWMWQLLFSRCHFRMTNRGGLQDHLVSSINRDGSNYIASVEYSKAASAVAAEFAEICRRYKAIGGKLCFDLSDTRKYPKIAQAPYFPLNRKAAGVWTPRIGDWGFASDPPQPGPDTRYFREARDVYLAGFRGTGDPRFAWLVQQLGRETESDEEWAAIEKAAAQQPADPFLTNRTRNMPGFGMSILEAHPNELDYRHKSAAILRTGVGQGHGHCDQLGITYYAEGCRLLTDAGRRGGTPNARGSRVHNLVEVDDKDFLTEAFNRTGVGWAEACNEMPGVSYASASARAPSHPYLKMFRRDVALVSVGDSGSYLLDLFRVAGGKVHTWCCEGPVCTSADQVSFNTPVSDQATPLLESYFGKAFEKRDEGVCPDILQVTWQVDPAVAARYLGGRGNAAQAPEVFVRAWRLGVKGDILLHRYTQLRDYTGTCPAHNYVHTRHEGKDGLEGAYATVTEGYSKGKPIIRNVVPLAINAPGAAAPRAVRVECANGQTDVICAAADDAVATTLEGGISVQGRFGYVSMRDGEVRRVSLLGGRLIEAKGVSLRPDVPVYAGKVTAVNLGQNTVTLDAALPAKALDGASFLVTRSADHNASYIASHVDGKAVQLRGAMAVFQTAITHFDAQTGRVSTDMQPVLLEASRTYYDDLPVANEAGQILGKAQVVEGDRYMYLGFPEHMIWRQRLRMNEIVDADGDGRRTLRMYSVGRSRRWMGEGQPLKELVDGDHMADLEVTRVSADDLMIWFKNPPEQYVDSSRVPHDSWPYQGMRLVTEDGKHTLTANYPGTEYTLGVKGRKLTEADFPDTDGDGRRCLTICDIAPGDRMETPAVATLTRADDGTWRLQANCGVTIGLPGRAPRHVTAAEAATGEVVVK